MNLYTFQLGIVGLVEEEWIDTLSTIDPDDITFIDYVEEGRRLAQELRDEVSACSLKSNQLIQFVIYKQSRCSWSTFVDHR